MVFQRDKIFVKCIVFQKYWRNLMIEKVIEHSEYITNCVFFMFLWSKCLSPFSYIFSIFLIGRSGDNTMLWWGWLDSNWDHLLSVRQWTNNGVISDFFFFFCACVRVLVQKISYFFFKVVLMLSYLWQTLL